MGSLLLALLACAVQTAGPPPAVVQRALQLDVRLDYEEGTITGTARLTVENVGATPLDSIPLLLGRLITVLRVQDADGSSLPFSQDIVTFDDWPSYQVNRIWVAPRTAVAPGARQVLAIGYAGTLVGYTETGMRYVRDRVDRDFTILRTDALAFPRLGVPNATASRAMPRGDFRFEAKVTVPRELVVATAVPASERIPAGDDVTWVFTGREPVPFLNVSIAPYHLLRSGALRIFHFAEDEVGAQTVLAGIEQAVALYSRWFGPLDRPPAITVMEIPEGWGSQSSLTGGIIQTADAFRDPRAMPQVYHEIAHLWHPVDTDAPPVRWNEGLATFLQWRIAAALDSTVSLDAAMDRTAARLLQRLTPDSRTVPMIEYGSAGLTDLSYSTGAVMFYLLYESLGAERFDAVLGSYYRAFPHTGTPTRAFADWLTDAEPRLRGTILEDWLFTARGIDRLETGESLAAIVESYRRAVR
jgi:hypothetical protein